MKGIGWDLARKLRGKPWVVFQEGFTGDGSTVEFTLTGTILNATLLSGVWNVSNVQITKAVSVTKTTGKALYDSTNVFTRNRVASSSVSAVGVVTLNYAPINGEDFYIYYWYECPNGTRLEDYYRDDIVAKTEADEPSTGASVSANTANFDGLLSATEDTIQKALDVLDDIKTGDSDIADALSKKHTQGTDTALGAVSAKNPPIDADLALYRDSTASNALVTSTWTQIKAFLKTYFDTLYNKYVHPNHSGDVTSVADGAQTIATAAVTLAKMANMATDSFIGRTTAETGVPEILSKSDALTILNVEDGAEANNISDVNATALTDSGETALHSHAGGSGTKYVAAMMAEGVHGAGGAGSTLPSTAEVAATGAVMETDFDANTILAATSDNTPVALTVNEQTVVGRITSGSITGLTAIQIRTLINVADGADVTSTNETSHADVLVDADIGGTVLAQQTIGIADNNLLEVDGTPNDNEFARFTASGLEGRTVSEVWSDLSLGQSGDNKIKNSGFIAASRASSLETYGAAIGVDTCSANLVANWSVSSATLVFDTDHYVLDPSGASSYFEFQNAGPGQKGHLYAISVKMKNGTSSGVRFEHLVVTDAYIYGEPFTTTADWVTYTFYYHQNSGTTITPGLTIATDPGGNIQMKDFYVYEVDSRFTGTGYGPDKHTLTSTIVADRIAEDYTHGNGFYSMKFAKGANGAELYSLVGTDYNNPNWYSEFVGRTISFGMYVYSVTAIDNVKIQITDSNGTTASEFVGADSKTWVEVSRTCGSSITSLDLLILLDGDTSDVAYVSQPVAKLGSAIGEGNYSRPRDEIILFDTYVASIHCDTWTGWADDNGSILQPYADSSGAVGYQTKAVLVNIGCNDDGSATAATYMALTNSDLACATFFLSLTGLANDSVNRLSGTVQLEPNGEVLFLYVSASAAAFDFPNFKYLGIITK